MPHTQDLLYAIFEQHLLNALVEDETTDEFLARVVSDYISELARQGTILREHVQLIETDLKDEVLEMFRKKTYGHYSLAEYRRTQKIAAEKPEPRSAATLTPKQIETGRRSRRPC